MIKVHLFDCPGCSHSIPVELRQAGQEMACPKCSLVFETPKMRELRLLPSTTSASGNGSRQPSRIRSGMFAIGFGLALVAGIAGYALYQYSVRLMPSATPEQIVAEQIKSIENGSINEIYSMWEYYYEDRHKLEWRETQLKSDYSQGSHLKTLSMGLFGLAAVGVGLVLFSLIVPKR
jgi:hypothetical protein